MSFESTRPLTNGHAVGGGAVDFEALNVALNSAVISTENNVFHGDQRMAYQQKSRSGFWDDIKNMVMVAWKNKSEVAAVAVKKVKDGQPDTVAGSKIIASLPEDSARRQTFIEGQVTEKYNKMLHPPLTYLGDAFQYRTADGKFNNVLSPHLGQAGAPYAKTVPSKTPVMGALPDPADVFDRLMAREGKGRQSPSGLSSMLLYHATIIIHDIFRTNDKDRNISDSSSYLDLSPLYGYTEEMQRKVRDDKYKLGLLKPDTFAEDRLLRQPPGVCIMLVMYNRYHNYAVTQLRRINENGRFSVPSNYRLTKSVAIAKNFLITKNKELEKFLANYQDAWAKNRKNGTRVPPEFAKDKLDAKIKSAKTDEELKKKIEEFEVAYDKAWSKLDDDLFNTARLITCGIYINVSIHDYLRALMGMHQYDTTFTLDPRVAINKEGQRDAISRGIGNQVTTEFNLLYRFHCAIPRRDEQFTETLMKRAVASKSDELPWGSAKWDPKTMTVHQFFQVAKATATDIKEPWLTEFGLPRPPTKDRMKGLSEDDRNWTFSRNVHSGLFDDAQMIKELTTAMDTPIGNFGALNVPKCMKSVEILGIIQARKWEVGTLNDFRDFFNMPRHKDFASISENLKVQNALRDLYDHPDKVELYPGIFCEGSRNDPTNAAANLSLDPGPNEKNFALWAAIFSDAITLVRSDRFYTVDWNTNSLTSWGMKEVTPDGGVFKSSVFNCLIQRAFPGRFPYNSIRFFHPFYTAKQNAKYAKEQGYAKYFNMEPSKRDSAVFDGTKSEAEVPRKPVILNTFAKVKAVLKDQTGLVCNPAALDTSWLPKDVAIVVDPKYKPPNLSSTKEPGLDKEMISKYFIDVTRATINREAYGVNTDTFQVDATRDVAIPVVTRYIADFLGFGDKLKSTTNPNAKYSENEIYEHITNCHFASAYIVDETKIWERRFAAKNSMEVLLDLVKDGNIKRASSRTVGSVFGFRSSNDPKPQNMAELGLAVARQTLKQENNKPGAAAAILLMTALDGAYNTVLAFSASLNHFMEGLYQKTESCDWSKLHYLAMANRDSEIRAMVLHAQQLSVRMPVVRKVTRDGTFKFSIENGDTSLSVKEKQIIVCDINQAYKHKLRSGSKSDASTSLDDYLSFGSSLSDGLLRFDAREVSVLGLTSMIKVFAQMRNLRRGHDTQGRLKTVNIDEISQGYANFMAQLRIVEIHDKVHKELFGPKDKMPEKGAPLNKAEEEAKRARALADPIRAEKEAKAEQEAAKAKAERAHEDAKKLVDIFSSQVLQPQTDMFLTPEWDEMVPFPTTWKIRFDGYGFSDYTEIVLNKPAWPDHLPPFYQPQGASHYGGSFASDVLLKEEQEKPEKEKQEKEKEKEKAKKANELKDFKQDKKTTKGAKITVEKSYVFADGEEQLPPPPPAGCGAFRA